MMLSQWAKQTGVGYSTARHWFALGCLPVPAVKLASGTIWVTPDAPAPDPATECVALYARVSSSDQRADLERQLGRLVTYAATAGLPVTAAVAEVGSGLGGKRPKLTKLLGDASVTVIVVEHRERLARFGVEYLEAALAAQGRRLVVINDTELADDLARDITEVLTSMCARLYGRRSAAARVARALAAAQAAPGALPPGGQRA